MSFTFSVNRVLQAAARLCICPESCFGNGYACLKKEPITLFKLCHLIINSNNPSPIGYCVASKLVNPCYSTAGELKVVLDAEFGANVANASSYLQEVCMQCNGCNENCLFQFSDTTGPSIMPFRLIG